MDSDIKEFLDEGDNEEIFDSLSISSGQYNDENLMNFAKKKLEFEKLVGKNIQEEEEDEIIIVKNKNIPSTRYDKYNEDEENYQDEEDYQEGEFEKKNPYDSDDSVDENENSKLNSSSFDPNNSYKHVMAVPKYSAGNVKLSTSEAKLYGLLDPNGGFKLNTGSNSSRFNKKKMLELSKPKEVYSKDSIPEEPIVKTKVKNLKDFKFDSKLYKEKKDNEEEIAQLEYSLNLDKKFCPKCKAFQTLDEVNKRTEICGRCNVKFTKKVFNSKEFTSKLTDYLQKSKLKQDEIDYNVTKFYGKTDRQIARIKSEEEVLNILYNIANGISEANASNASRKNSILPNDSDAKPIVNSRRDSKSSRIIPSIQYKSITVNIIIPCVSIDNPELIVEKKKKLIIPIPPSASTLLSNLYNQQHTIESKTVPLYKKLSVLLKDPSLTSDQSSSIPFFVTMPEEIRKISPEELEEVRKPPKKVESIPPKQQINNISSKLNQTIESDAKNKVTYVSRAPDAKDVVIKTLDAKTVADSLIHANNEKAKMIEKAFGLNSNNSGNSGKPPLHHVNSNSTASKMERLVNY